MKQVLFLIIICINFFYSSIIVNAIDLNILPNYTSYVNDFTSTLSKQTIDELNNILSDFDQKTSHQIAVAIIDTLNDIPIEEYSIELARKWGIGQKGLNNGVLLLVAKNDRQLRIEVGYGLEGYLTDLQSKWIINNVIVPKFKEGDFDSGIKDGIQKIINAISNTEIIPVENENKDENLMLLFLPFIIFIFIWILPVFFARNKSVWEGALIGGVIFGVMFWSITGVIFGIIFGLILDLIASYTRLNNIIKKGTNTSIWSSSGGFSVGNFGGGGISFGGGSFGGGGSSGKW